MLHSKEPVVVVESHLFWEVSVPIHIHASFIMTHLISLHGCPLRFPLQVFPLLSMLTVHNPHHFIHHMILHSTTDSKNHRHCNSAQLLPSAG